MIVFDKGFVCKKISCVLKEKDSMIVFDKGFVCKKISCVLKAYLLKCTYGKTN
jgi:hypothetical protein